MEQQVLTSNKNSFSEFDQNKGIYDSAKKGAYIIIPLAYLTHKNLPALAYPGEIAEPLDFYSEDLSDLLLQKCKQSSGFVRRFRTTALTAAFKDFSDSISVCDSQVFIFNKGVALLAVWAVYDDARAFYEFVNPGYIGVQMTNENKPLQEKFIETLDKTIQVGSDQNLHL